MWTRFFVQKRRIAAFKHGKRFGADDAVLSAAASYDEGEAQCAPQRSKIPDYFFCRNRLLQNRHGRVSKASDPREVICVRHHGDSEVGAERLSEMSLNFPD